MNKSFAAYTPRSRPLEYDAILGRSGCEAESGATYFGLKAPERLCVSPHDDSSVIFNQPPTVSYSYGPATKGVQSKPFLTSWAAWVGTVGIRVGKYSRVTPPANLLGDLSALYPTAQPAALSHAFDDEGLVAIAIQKTSTTIELKWYTGHGGENSVATWTGNSPALLNSSLVLHGDPAAAGLVCYYLSPANPRVLYARFGVEDFAVERIIVPELRLPLARLINAASYDTKVLIYALDPVGRDVTLTTPRHAATDAAAFGLEVALDGGSVFVTAVDAGVAETSACTLDIGAPAGQVYSPLIEPAVSPPAESVSLSVALVGGEVI